MSDRSPFDKFLSDAAEEMMMNGNLYLASDGENVTVVKSSAYVPVSYELLIDSGAMTEDEARARGWTPTPRPRIPWHRKLRWRIDNLRERLAYRLFRLVAGYEMRDDDE